MDVTEQLLSPHFLEAIKVTKKNAEGFTAGKTCKIVAYTCSVIMILYNHKLFGRLQKCDLSIICYLFLT